MKKLTEVEERFILHWGEMGTQWGINRTVAQIHALLYLSAEALNAEDICAILGIARSNVSTSLKELQSWGIVRRVHHLDDRRDHFTSEKDVWEMARLILAERKKREIDPTLSVLRDCLIQLEADRKADPETRTRLREFLEFLEISTSWFDQISRWPTKALITMLKLGGRLRKRIAVE